MPVEFWMKHYANNNIRRINDFRIPRLVRTKRVRNVINLSRRGKKYTGKRSWGRLVN